MNNVLNLDELKATKQIIENVIEKEEEEEYKRKGYKVMEQPTRQELNLMTPKEISKIYRIGENRIRELIHADRTISNNFPVIRMGRKSLIPKHKFEEWLIEACEIGLRI
ncbi:helix-turn-helix domain-containing protein [Peptostreptococcus porci]|uniref:helix-turn-helix domain-containing protein n=1 Tax=Peptostreptococcus porci TaxID=2652282 RepID=UPI002A819E61|nr:helix-turn-helix domain-containing protein [Peptostreptococcus porci]MDY4127959.1 helix-turn-helix domain-containing protein [Peptostreptococcus porci]